VRRSDGTRSAAGPFPPHYVNDAFLGLLPGGATEEVVGFPTENRKTGIIGPVYYRRIVDLEQYINRSNILPRVSSQRNLYLHYRQIWLRNQP